MSGEISWKGKEKGTQHQGHHKNRKHNMWNENKEIDRTHKTLTGKGRIAYKMMIDDVAHQKERWGYKGRNHKAHVFDEITSPNFAKAQQQKYRT